MTAAIAQRPLLISTSLLGYGAVAVAFALLEVPGLGIGHFFYLPIALLALATNRTLGALAGLLGAALYATAVILNPHFPSTEVLTISTAIRAITYMTTGTLIGWFASTKRDVVARLQELAERDFLTGLLNTRAFEESLARRCAGPRRFTLLLADLDGL